MVFYTLETQKRIGIFHLDGTSAYGLSYLDDVPFEWLEQAVHGLETMLPFCVKSLGASFAW